MEGVKTCEGCGAKCCKYVALEIDCPEDLDDFENIRWYVAHENIRVFVEEDDTWNIEFSTPCKYLDGERCSIHEKFVENPVVRRPKICGEFNTEICPQHNTYKEKYDFTSLEDVDRYITDVFYAGEHIVNE